MKEIIEKVNFEKKSAEDNNKKHEKLSSMQRIKTDILIRESYRFFSYVVGIPTQNNHLNEQPKQKSRPRCYKTFNMLQSLGHEICSGHKL